MRQTGIFFLLSSIVILMALATRLLSFGMFEAASILGIIILAVIIAGWYIDLGSRREYTGRAIRMCDLAPGRYVVNHYGVYDDGSISAVVLINGIDKLCYIDNYTILETTWEWIEMGHPMDLIIEGGNTKRKVFVCARKLSN